MSEASILNPTQAVSQQAIQPAQAKIVNPMDSVVLGNDGHLEPIAHHNLNPNFIQAALQNWQSVKPLSAGDGHRFAGRTLKQAAVLLGLIEKNNALHLVLTQRSGHLRNHAGQIALPGGACDTQDVDSWHTALREAHEEIGLHSRNVQCLGRFHNYNTVTAFAVSPWVAHINADTAFQPNAAEVAQVFDIALSTLLNPSNHQRRSVITPVGERTFYAIPCDDSSGQPRFVWGATAGMLRNFYQTLLRHQTASALAR